MLKTLYRWKFTLLQFETLMLDGTEKHLIYKGNVAFSIGTTSALAGILILDSILPLLAFTNFGEDLFGHHN